MADAGPSNNGEGVVYRARVTVIGHDWIGRSSLSRWPSGVLLQRGHNQLLKSQVRRCPRDERRC